MDKIQKALRKLSKKEQKWVADILEKLRTEKTKHLDIKKLKGHTDIFRVRKGQIRILFRRGGGSIFILGIERRDGDTYKNI